MEAYVRTASAENGGVACLLSVAADRMPWRGTLQFRIAVMIKAGMDERETRKVRRLIAMVEGDRRRQTGQVLR